MTVLGYAKKIKNCYLFDGIPSTKCVKQDKSRCIERARDLDGLIINGTHLHFMLYF